MRILNIKYPLNIFLQLVYELERSLQNVEVSGQPSNYSPHKHQTLLLFNNIYLIINNSLKRHTKNHPSDWHNITSTTERIIVWRGGYLQFMFENICTQIFTFNAYSQPHSRTEVYLFLLSERYLIATHLIPVGQLWTILPIKKLIKRCCMFHAQIKTDYCCLSSWNRFFVCLIRCIINLILLYILLILSVPCFFYNYCIMYDFMREF